MTEQDLRDYVRDTTNLAPLARVVKSRNPVLYQDIIDSWPYSTPYTNFVEAVRLYLYNDSIFCPYGHRMKFNGVNHPYTCTKQCKYTIQKHKDTMLRRHGVEHALQHPASKKKFKQTLQSRYGFDNLYDAFKDQRIDTNIQRYGAETPLESTLIRTRTAETFKQRTGYNSPFDKFNSAAHKDKYRAKAQATYISNNPEKYDYDLIRSTLLTNSIAKTSELLGLWPSHIKSVIVSQGWEDLLPKKSSYETLISRFLKDYNIQYIANSRSVIPPYELDFYIPDANVAIEINGLRWHSESFGGKEKQYHLTKTQLCEDAGIQLIHIFEDELNNHTNTVLSILKTHLNIPKVKVYARKCKLTEVSTVIAREFCTEHHLQGYTAASHKFGLYNDETLLAVMTFKYTGAEYELSRYCVHPDYQLVGGAQRLFTAFKRLSPNTQVYTYSDKRYFSGNLYKSLGFAFSHDTQPNYWYFTNSKCRYHRLRFNKAKLVNQGHDSSLTEWEIMQYLGYDRIWDCGSKKWVLNTNTTKGGTHES